MTTKISCEVAGGTVIIRREVIDPTTSDTEHSCIGMPVAEARKWALELTNALAGIERPQVQEFERAPKYVTEIADCDECDAGLVPCLIPVATDGRAIAKICLVCADRLARESRRRAANATGVAEATRSILDVLGLRSPGSHRRTVDPCQAEPMDV